MHGHAMVVMVSSSRGGVSKICEVYIWVPTQIVEHPLNVASKGDFAFCGDGDYMTWPRIIVETPLSHKCLFDHRCRIATWNA